MAQVSKDLPDVSSEFIESGKLSKINSKKKGGPYSKDEKVKRMDEVYRLHFEYGYSARKISELMKINRNTISSDIDHWYNKILINTNFLNLEGHVMISLKRLDVQRSRLRENMDKSENFQQRHVIEKMIFDIECKIININMKLADSTKRIQNIKMEYLNRYLKIKGEETRYVSIFDRLALSKKAHEKIFKILRDDRNKDGF